MPSKGRLECGKNNEIKNNEVAGTIAEWESRTDERASKAARGTEKLETGAEADTRGVAERAKCSGRVPIIFIIFRHRGSAPICAAQGAVQADKRPEQLQILPDPPRCRCLSSGQRE